MFDAADIEGIGELVSHTDPSGATTTLTYGAADPNVHQFVPLTSVTDAAGQTVTLESDGVGRVTAFRLPDGRMWRLAYDGGGNLVSITDATGGTRSFTYDAAHRMLTTATDASGSTYLVNVYDDQGRVVSQRDAEGTERRFSYEAGRTVYTDNEGRRSVFGFDDRYRITSVENPAGQVARWEFDARGDVTSHTDEADAPRGTSTTRRAIWRARRMPRATRPGTPRPRRVRWHPEPTRSDAPGRTPTTRVASSRARPGPMGRRRGTSTPRAATSPRRSHRRGRGPGTSTTPAATSPR